MVEHWKTCPHCGASLPEEAAFCPDCAGSINSRAVLTPPWFFPRRLALALTAALLAAASFFAFWLAARPRIYEGNGSVPSEVIYTNANGTYQLHINPDADRNAISAGKTYWEETDYDYRFPLRLYINHIESGADAGAVFLQQVDHTTMEVESRDGPFHYISCTDPAPNAAIPGAASVSFIDSNILGDCRAGFLWTLYMKNGDRIRLRWTADFNAVPVHEYYPADYPMETVEQLQALVDEISETVDPGEIVKIYLPPVTYTGPLRIQDRCINLYGNTEGPQRTTFRDNIQLTAHADISYFEDIDFTGDGSGVGLSVSSALHLTGCTISGWRTGVLAYGNTWVNLSECRVENNEIGFHFNATGNYVTRSIYQDNLFRDNQTAVLLENVSTDVILHFPGTVFSGNGTDIDNRCGQELDISESVFQ